MPCWFRPPEVRLRRAGIRRLPVSAEVQVLQSRTLLSAPDAGGEMLGDDLQAGAEQLEIPVQVQSLLHSQLGEAGGLLHGVLSAAFGKVQAKLDAAATVIERVPIDRADMDEAFAQLADSGDLESFGSSTVLSVVNERLQPRIQQAISRLDHAFGLINSKLTELQSRLEGVLSDNQGEELSLLFDGLREKLQGVHTNLGSLLSGLADIDDSETPAEST